MIAGEAVGWKLIAFVYEQNVKEDFVFNISPTSRCKLHSAVIITRVYDRPQF